MVCEIVSVGTELLLGEIANTDAQFISQGLAELGITVYYHTVCGDNPERLKKALAIASQRAQLIITTGGLGPTADDLTKETIAAAFGRPLYTDPVQLERLKARMGPGMTPNNLKQADLPEGCTVLENDWGTAPGCAFTWGDGGHLIMLPGPPSECRPMFTCRAKPYLEALTDGVIRSCFIKVFGMGESAMESKLSFLMDTLENPTAAPYAKDGECEVRVTARAATEQQALELCRPVVEQIKQILGDVVYGVDVSSLEQVCVQRLTELHRKVATAESCTGGLLAKRITDVPGASACFDGGIVTYATDMKLKYLGVDPETVRTYGVISPETAIEMARGARKLCGADYGLGVTGNAGPSAMEGKPAGLFYAAISCDDGEEVFTRSMKRTRAGLRNYAASAALDLLRKKLF